jgi:hypothetical protein
VPAKAIAQATVLTVLVLTKAQTCELLENKLAIVILKYITA